jgi:hypothetical protein
MIQYGTDGVGRHTSVGRVETYIDRATLEQIACVLLEGLLLGLSLGHSILVCSNRLHLECLTKSA